jgi:hypothetical protein
MNIDWLSKLRHLLQVLGYCLAVATLQYAFQPDRPYAPPVVYSLFIGTSTWAIIDLGRPFLPSSAETGWPRGAAGVLLVIAGIVGGYLMGNWLGNAVCHAWHLYPPGALVDPATDLRNSLLITAVAGIAGSYYFYSTNRSAYLERKMSEAKRHANEARLKLLETQLEPHMLFNTLANLRVLIGVDPTRAQEMLDHMIAYLRATLDASRTTTHSLQAEFDRVQDYLALMAIRMGPRLRYALDLPPELAQVPVPALLLQPLVENSIKHGLEPKVEGGSVRVSARREGSDLVLEVADTGVGPSESGESVKGRGFGMGHVRERLVTLHGATATMDFAPAAEGGSRAVLRFPCPA